MGLASFESKVVDSPGETLLETEICIDACLRARYLKRLHHRQQQLVRFGLAPTKFGSSKESQPMQIGSGPLERLIIAVHVRPQVSVDHLAAASGGRACLCASWGVAMQHGLRTCALGKPSLSSQFLRKERCLRLKLRRRSLSPSVVSGPSWLQLRAQTPKAARPPAGSPKAEITSIAFTMPIPCTPSV